MGTILLMIVLTVNFSYAYFTLIGVFKCCELPIYYVHGTGISASDTIKLESVQEKDLSVKELKVSIPLYPHAQHILNSGKDRFTIFTVSCIECWLFM